LIKQFVRSTNAGGVEQYLGNSGEPSNSEAEVTNIGESNIRESNCRVKLKSGVSN
jgi:hypothetical protein